MVNKFKYNIRSQRLEYLFRNELEDFIFKLGYKLETQKPVLNNKYRIDFYIPALNLAIEYDEHEHRFKKQEDLDREFKIHNEIQCSFIRINQDMSVGEALGLISKYIIKAA